MTSRRGLFARTRPLMAAAVLAGCSASAPPPPSAAPGAMERPAVPAGWRTITSDEGDVRVVVPPDADVLQTAGSVLAQAPTDVPGAPFEVWVTGPAAIIQPTGGQSTMHWLEDSGWMPREGGGIVFGPTTERELFLPAGRAIEVTTSVQPGTPDEGGVVLYVVETGGGFAIVRFVGTPALLEQRTLQIQLISQLVEFVD